LIVDDDSKLAGSLARGLRREGYAVDLASSGEDALLQARVYDYDAVILDVMIPAPDGVEVCRALRQDGRWAPVLMLTARDGVGDRIRGLDAGADDYLVKPFAYEELMARIRALLRRQAPRARKVLRYADLTMDLGTREVLRGELPVALTPKEFDLLQHLLRNPRQVLTRDRILDAVWGYDFGATSNSVDVYVGYLRQKLEADGRPRLIQTIRGVGYALREE
jgi:two-component system response regulator MprA